MDKMFNPYCPYFLSSHETRPELPFNRTLSQNMVSFHQNIDVNMEYRYCVIIIEHQIDEKQQSSSIIHQSFPKFKGTN